MAAEKNKLDGRIKWLKGHTDENLRILQEMDEQEGKEEAALLEENLEQLTREIIEADSRGL